MKTDRILKWWKKEDRYLTWLKAVLMACLPVVCCVVYCAARGESIGRVYLPASGMNDELFYFKQTESILRYGYPQGYFGFNESHALKLSFAAWSPFLALPWVVWGALFGWNLLSPVYCHIFLMALALFLFVLLAKPGWKQTGILALLYALYTPFSWYMLSGMPEINCISILIVFYGLAAAWFRKERKALLAAMFVLAGLLTLMRPYLLLFLVLPAFLWSFPMEEASGEGQGKAKKGIRVSWLGVLGSGLVICGVLGCYALVNHFLAAEYFEPLFYMDWLTDFFEKGFLGGLRSFFGELYYSGVEFWQYMRQGMMSGFAAGAIFCCYMGMFLVIACQTLKDFRHLRRQKSGGPDRKAYGQLVIEGHLTFAFFGMLMAQLLMYNFYDGCKHLLTFLAAGIFVISLMRTAYYKKAVMTGLLLAYFLTYNTGGFRDYQPSFRNETVAGNMEAWEEAVERELILSGEKTPNYDNVVIWVFSDRLPEGVVSTGWQYLYALPAGFGISCCTSEYVLEHFDTLQSRYLCVVPGGEVEADCIRKGYRKISENEFAVLYECRENR